MKEAQTFPKGTALNNPGPLSSFGKPPEAPHTNKGPNLKNKNSKGNMGKSTHTFKNPHAKGSGSGI